jgi:phosphonate transport system permease protein
MDPNAMTDTTMAAPAPALPAPRAPWAILARTALLAIGAAVLVWAWNSAEMNPVQLVRDAGNMADLGRDFLRPDFTDLDFYLKGMAETFAIAIWGTLLAMILGVPFALLSSSNIAPWWITVPVRRLMDALRAINELVFALIFIASVGLGPFAGVMALFVHTTGIFAKLFSEAVEAIDHGPIEGIRGTGASKLQEIVFGVIPQVLPLWVSFVLYRFESNVRSATVIGIVGGGGIGMTFNEVMRSFQYQQAGAILILVVLAVSALDILSQQIRRQFI